MVSDRITKTLREKSELHQQQLLKLGQVSEDAPLSENVIVMDQTKQIVGINTLLLDPMLPREDFIFYFDRVAALLIERAVSLVPFKPIIITTPQSYIYTGFQPSASISAVSILRGGSALETALKRVIPSCRTGRLLIQTNYRTGEPELHYCALASPPHHSSGNGDQSGKEADEGDELVLLLDAQMSSGGAALMAVRVLMDHGVKEERMVFVAYTAGRRGVARLMGAFPGIRVVVGRLVDDYEERWVEQKYLGC
jgi:uridine kinase